MTQNSLLVVDNEVEICNFVRLFFEQRGFEIFQAHNTQEAIEAVCDHKPEVVLLDIKMQTADEGFLILEKIRKLIPYSKIIMVTGIDDDASVARGRLLGADGYITKPLVLEDLEKAVLSRSPGRKDL